MSDKVIDLQKEFEKSAYGISEQFVLDTADVKSAYDSKKDSLVTLHDTMKDAKHRRNVDIFWTAAAALTITPLAILPGYFAFKQHERLQKVGETVRSEVAVRKAAPAPVAAAPQA